ncbi:MAG: ribonuclease J [Deltaproteobacteria bacterium]|jgi:ribonuclease J|nr:ribonuclease J [Deltaproteobacteria bacterium]MDA8308999.1 ribonuclease J [Deltaproteobacteria bacterium]
MPEKTACSTLKVIPLGGLGEIGLNMMVFEYEDSIVIVDSGLMFPEEEMLGIDIVIPDFSYLLGRKEKVAALVVTHGHEDHIGAIPFLVREFPLPIYGTALTLALIREKLREHNLLDRVELIQIVPRQVVEIGPFSFEFIRVCHSIPDGVGLAIRTPVGVIIHSGDFKIDNTPVDDKRLDIARLGSYGEEGVLALFSDSTNVERPGYTVSEKEVGVTLRNVLQEKQGRVIVAVFASNLHRIQQLIHIAREFDRKVLLSGKSMVTNVRIARELGCLDFTKEDEIAIQDLQNLPDSRVLMLTTGTQGEPMSALSRMAFNDHKKLKVREGDTIILSSRFIPGNERTIQNIMNHLCRNGAEVIHEQVKDIHVSGHACQEELKIMINVVQPRFFIPIHGEYRHLVKHRQLALSLGISPANCLLIENGGVLCFSPDSVCTKEKIETGRVFVDGKGVGDVGGLVLRDRRHLSEDGLVIASLVVNKETHEILSGPDILSRGFIHEEAKPEILYEGKCIILENIDRQLEEAHELDCALLQEQIRRDLKRFFIRTLDRRPVIYPIVVEI